MALQPQHPYVPLFDINNISFVEEYKVFETNEINIFANLFSRDEAGDIIRPPLPVPPPDPLYTPLSRAGIGIDPNNNVSHNL